MQRPDIIFIVLDTQRADRLGCYGHQPRAVGKSVTPNLDGIAGQGALFDRAISPAQWTVPSHASMFTGLYPTAHRVTQSNHSLGPDRPHLAEVLNRVGYQTLGYCNNPLVGILNNGFKRGFQTFYNYGGAIPSMPQYTTRLPSPIGRALEAYTQFLRRISYPIQNFFARSDLAFRVSLNAWLTPLWSRMANFKGQNERSVRDVTRFLRRREMSGDERPLFLFLNLMETHLPFWPPGSFVDQVAPYLRESREARSVIRSWNRQAYRWNAPLAEPLGGLEDQVLNDMYDAEVAYQDHYLGQLFEALNQRANARNTLMIIVADHGDGLGEHNFVGHAFVVYQELVRVPLIISWPGRVPVGTQIEAPVSTRRVFHTILEAAGVTSGDSHGLDGDKAGDLTLLESIGGRDPERGVALAEAYPPLNFTKAVRFRQPELLERCRCLAMRRAVVKGQRKLIQIDGNADEFFDLAADPQELADLMAGRPAEVSALDVELNKLIRLTEAQGEKLAVGTEVDPEADDHLIQRLRGLGYID